VHAAVGRRSWDWEPALDRGIFYLHRVLGVAPLQACTLRLSLFRKSELEPPRQLIGSVATCSSHSGHRTVRIGSLPTRQKVLTAATWDVFWRRQD
jgi:hypothetical protein